MSSTEHLEDGSAVGPDAGSVPAPAARRSSSFGSPGSDATVRRISLDDALIRHPQATFVVRAQGSAMRRAGIDAGDVLLVDRALTPQHGNIVIAAVGGELVCRRLSKQGSRLALKAEGDGEPDIEPREGETVELWGVVTTAIKSLLD